MPGAIVVGLDGSEASDRAADCAADEARANGLRLVLTCVIPWSPYQFATGEENERRHIEREREITTARERIVQPTRERLSGGRPVGIDEVIRHGHPAETLVAVAREVDAARIVVGRIGQSRVRTLLFGSTPSSLIQLTDVPVLVVP